MALFTVDCFSETLGMSVNMNVIMPQNIEIANPVNGGHFTPPYPVLYLLHGWNGDHTVWLRRTSIERYASDKGIIVIMPAAHLSFYCDMAMGFRYWTYISQELPKICHDLFPQMTTDPAQTFAAGLSMGGYGAFKLGLALPERFAGVASLSGAVDVAAMVERLSKEAGFNASVFHSIYGTERIYGSKNDLFTLLSQDLQSDKKLPSMYQWCGKQDFLYQDNLRLRDELIKAGVDLTYEEADGDHQWVYWDRGIARVLDWIMELLHQ